MKDFNSEIRRIDIDAEGGLKEYMEFMREQRTSDARNPVLIDSGQLAEAEERLKSLVFRPPSP